MKVVVRAKRAQLLVRINKVSLLDKLSLDLLYAYALIQHVQL